MLLLLLLLLYLTRYELLFFSEHKVKMSLPLLQHDFTSGHYDKDPVLMDDELLQRAVTEQCCQIAKAGEIHFDQVPKLCLGYKGMKNHKIIDHCMAVYLL